MSGALLGAYRPGDTWLHRLPAGAKLLALLMAGVTLSVLRGPVSAMVALTIALLLVLWSGTPLRGLARTLRGIALIALVLGGWLAWQKGWPRAVETVGDLAALILAATVLTVTTPVEQILDTLVRVLAPLRRFGVNPERVALAFSLVIRAIPHTVGLAEETRAAARARGLERSPRARLIPFVIRVVAHAQATGEALHARGVGDDLPSPTQGER